MRKMYSEKQLKEMALSTIENASSINVNGKLSANEIVENMSGYSVSNISSKITATYVGVVKNGNKITFVIFGSFTKDGSNAAFKMLEFNIPADIGVKLYPYQVGTEYTFLDNKTLSVVQSDDPYTYANMSCDIQKSNNTTLEVNARVITGLTTNKTYIFRYEATFLLSENLAPEE